MFIIMIIHYYYYYYSYIEIYQLYGFCILMGEDQQIKLWQKSQKANFCRVKKLIGLVVLLSTLMISIITIQKSDKGHNFIFT